MKHSLRHIVSSVFLAAAVLYSSGCNRGAATYLSRGEKNFKAGKYADAAIEFRKAIQKDPKLGEAYYQLGLTQLERRDYSEAFQSLTRANELLQHRSDVKVKLGDLVLSAYEADPRNVQLYSELSRLTNEILVADPNSFEGLRMKGNLALLDRKPDLAVQSFQRANEIRPLQEYVVVGYTQALIQAHRGQQAEHLAWQLIERKKDFRPIYDVLYDYYLTAGDTGAAERVLRTRIQNNPEDSGGFIQLAAYYRQAQKPAAVDEVIQELLRDPVTRPDAFMAAGDFYAGVGAWEQAASIYEKGTSAQASQALNFRKRLAMVRVGQKRLDDALAILEKILAEKPGDSEAGILEGELLTSRATPADLDKAISIYQAILKNQPDQAVALSGLGSAYYARKDLESARQAFLSARQRDPRVPNADILLASISLRQGKPADALIVAEDLLRENPDNPRALYLQVNALMQLGRYDEARPELEKLAAKYPASRDLNVLRGVLAILSNRYQDAQTIFASLPKSDDSDPIIAAGLAESYVGRKEFSQALQMLEAEARRAPQKTEIRRMLARTAVAAGQYDRGINELQNLLHKDPNSTALLTDIGDAYREKGDFPRAAEAYEKVIARQPNNPASYLALGFVLDGSGKHAEATQAYRKVLALRPNDSLAMNNLAFALSATGNGHDLDEALTLAQRALQVSPNEPELTDTLGWIWLKKGRADTALDLFGPLSQANPSNASYKHHLGLALLARGDRSSGERTLEAALLSSPSRAEADEIRQTLEQARAK